MTRTMYDSVSLDQIPADATMVAAYQDGAYANVDEARRRFPRALIVTITVTGRNDANVGDVEAGDMTPDSGARWAATQVRKGKHPTLYFSLSQWDAVRQAVRAHGLTDAQVSYWVADYDNKPELPAGAVAKQYRSTTTPNLDTSIVADHWPGVDPPQVHQDRFLRLTNPPMTGQDVKDVQHALNVAGNHLVEDGVYGTDTAVLVNAFNHNHQIKGSDGQIARGVTPATWQELREIVHGGGPT